MARKGKEKTPDTFEEWLEYGDMLYEDDRYEEALSAYDQVRAADAGYLHALNRKGNILSLIGRDEEALELFERVLELGPDEPLLADVALNNKANVLRILGRTEEALVAYDRALMIEPGNVMALNNKGNVYSDLGRDEEALEMYEKAPAIARVVQHHRTRRSCATRCSPPRNA